MSWRQCRDDLELAVACGPGRHRLRWRAGVVETPDHPDLAAERALVAFGGPEPTCLWYLRLWHDALADGGFLGEWVEESHLTDARLSWLGAALDRLRLEGFHEFLRMLPPARAERMGQFLHRFPRPWLDRAAAEVAEAVVDGPGVACTLAPDLVTLAVAQRLRPAFVASVGGRLLSYGAAALVPLSVAVEAGATASLTGTMAGPGRGVRVRVDRGWLHRVWAAGAAVIEGQLVLDALADQEDGCRLRATTVRWEPRPGRDATAGPGVGAGVGAGDLEPRVEQRTAGLDGSTWRWLDDA